MAFDPTVDKWKRENIFRFSDGHLTLQTIILPRQTFQSVIFETDFEGRLTDLGIKFIKEHDNIRDADSWHNFMCNDFLKNNLNMTLNSIYKKIFLEDQMSINDGPFFLKFDKPVQGNSIVGQIIG